MSRLRPHPWLLAPGSGSQRNSMEQRPRREANQEVTVTPCSYVSCVLRPRIFVYIYICMLQYIHTYIPFFVHNNYTPAKPNIPSCPVPNCLRWHRSGARRGRRARGLPPGGGLPGGSRRRGLSRKNHKIEGTQPAIDRVCCKISEMQVM